MLAIAFYMTQRRRGSGKKSVSQDESEEIAPCSTGGNNIFETTYFPERMTIPDVSYNKILLAITRGTFERDEIIASEHRYRPRKRMISL